MICIDYDPTSPVSNEIWENDSTHCDTESVVIRLVSNSFSVLYLRKRSFYFGGRFVVNAPSTQKGK